MIKKTIKTVIYTIGLVTCFILLDKLMGRILLKFDPEFRNLLISKLKRNDIQATKEQVFHILKPATLANGVAAQKPIIN